MFLLDTDVISGSRRLERSAALSAWLNGQAEDHLFISVISLGEVEGGIRQQEKRNPEFAADLSIWIKRTTTLFQDRILPFSAEDARIWGRLSADIGHNGADLMIAATALAHNATVVTGNTSDFEPTGVTLVDPFQ